MTHDTACASGHDRRFLAYFSTIGLGTSLLPGVLWAEWRQAAEITVATIAAAESRGPALLRRTAEADGRRQRSRREQQLEQLHQVKLDNAVAPAMRDFDPVPPGVALELPAKRPTRRSRSLRAMPQNLEELAFLPVSELSRAGATPQGDVGAAPLRDVSAGRLEIRSIAQVRRVAHRGVRAGRRVRIGADDTMVHFARYPVGCRHLLAVKGYKTTWGAGPFRDQVIWKYRCDRGAAAGRRRCNARGKLTLGELAMGDVWFGGTTENPWNVTHGDPVAHRQDPPRQRRPRLVGFAIGSETAAPSPRQRHTQWRHRTSSTFGRVPRTPGRWHCHGRWTSSGPSRAR